MTAIQGLSNLDDLLKAVSGKMPDTVSPPVNASGSQFITDTMEAETIVNTARRMADWAGEATDVEASVRRWMAVAATREMALDAYAQIIRKLPRNLSTTV